jgi:hypothetical protein
VHREAIDNPERGRAKVGARLKRAETLTVEEPRLPEVAP